MTSTPTVAVGTAIPPLIRTPDPVDLFSFSAAAWLLHRIHYDLPFTSDHDGHPGLLIHGPLQGTYLIQSVQWWLGPTAELRTISYRHARPAYAGETLTCSGRVTAVDATAGTFDVELWAKKQVEDAEDGDADGVITTSGTATFRLPDGEAR